MDCAVTFSDVTPYERAILEPSLHYLFDKNNCDKKVDNLVKRNRLSYDDAEQQIKSLCAGTSRKTGETSDFEYWICPCRIVDPSVTYLVSSALAMRNGILPFEGGYMDQPANVMAALSIVQNFLSEYEESERKKAERKKGRK